MEIDNDEKRGDDGPAVGLYYIHYNDDDVRCEVRETSSVFMIIIVRCTLLLKN